MINFDILIVIIIIMWTLSPKVMIFQNSQKKPLFQDGCLYKGRKKSSLIIPGLKMWTTMLHGSGATSTNPFSRRTQMPLKPPLSYKLKTEMKMVSKWCFLKKMFDYRWFSGTGNAMVRYRIVEGDTGGNFSIDSVTGEVGDIAPQSVVGDRW